MVSLHPLIMNGIMQQNPVNKKSKQQAIQVRAPGSRVTCVTMSSLQRGHVRRTGFDPLDAMALAILCPSWDLFVKLPGWLAGLPAAWIGGYDGPGPGPGRGGG